MIHEKVTLKFNPNEISNIESNLGTNKCKVS